MSNDENIRLLFTTTMSHEETYKPSSLPKYILQAHLRLAKHLLRDRGDVVAAHSIRLRGKREALEEQCVRFNGVIESALMMKDQSRLQNNGEQEQLPTSTRMNANQLPTSKTVNAKRLFHRVLQWIRQRKRRLLLVGQTTTSLPSDFQI